MFGKYLISITLFVLSFVAYAADCPRNCDKSCCTSGPFRLKVCDPTGTCQSACALYNTSCGHPEIPFPLGPVLPPNTSPTYPIPSELLPTLLTGGMVNPVTVKATNDAIATIEKALSDLRKTADKAVQDTVNEAGRTARNIGTAVDAIAEFAKAEVAGKQNLVHNAVERVREGKVIDVLWSLGTEDLQNENKAAAAAALKSEIIRTAGSVAASVYGGPAGAAAYAAWLTYNQTGGDVNMALKVGMIAGATSWSLAKTQALPVQNSAGNIVVPDLAKKVAVTAAIGGLAVAAAGGNEDAIRKAFLQAGAMVVIQEGYREYLGHPLDDEHLRASKGNPTCISATVNCQNPPQDAFVYKDNKFIGWDQRKLDPLAPHVGTSYPDVSINPGDVTWPSEGSAFMRGISKIPGANAMAVFHDQWAVDWVMPRGVLETTILPAIVLIYNGTTAPLLETVRVAAIDSSKKELTSTIQTVKKDETSKVPIITDQIEKTFVCETPTDSRSIIVEVDPQKRAFACRVIYRANHMRIIAWRAMHDATYCDRKATLLANTQLRVGYKCRVGISTQKNSTPNAKPEAL